MEHDSIESFGRFGIFLSALCLILLVVFAYEGILFVWLGFILSFSILLGLIIHEYICPWLFNRLQHEEVEKWKLEHPDWAERLEQFKKQQETPKNG